jgi:hypothetical protein
VKLTIDTDAGTVAVDDRDGSRQWPLASAEGFALVSDAWLRAGWDLKYVYRAPRTMTIFSSDQSPARRDGDFGS